jgi:hypothetical protein
VQIFHRSENYSLPLIFSITVALCVLLSIGNRSAAAETRGADIEAQIKLPDGLYMFQPYQGVRLGKRIRQRNEECSAYDPACTEHLTDTEEYIDYTTVRPLVVVERGRFTDPFQLANRIGVANFQRKYVMGKSFHAYSDDVLVGSISRIAFKVTHTCSGPAFSNLVQGKGDYSLASHSGLPGSREILQLEIPDQAKPVEIEVPHIVLTPSVLRNTRLRGFAVSAKDAERILSRARADINPKLLDRIKVDFQEPILNEEAMKRRAGSYLEFLQAADLDKNGKTDFLGVYQLLMPNGQGGVVTYTSAFVLRDTGALEVIAVGSINDKPAVLGYHFGGLIDTNQDGFDELIVVSDIAVGNESGVQVSISMRMRDVWKSVYQTRVGCRNTYVGL